MTRIPPALRAVIREGLIVVGCLLLLAYGGLLIAAGAFGYGDGWKAWAMPITGIGMVIAAGRMGQVRLARENRIKRAGHKRRAWARAK